MVRGIVQTNGFVLSGSASWTQEDC
jgi:hypothetical protein